MSDNIGNVPNITVRYNPGLMRELRDIAEAVKRLGLQDDIELIKHDFYCIIFELGRIHGDHWLLEHIAEIALRGLHYRDTM